MPSSTALEIASRFALPSAVASTFSISSTSNFSGASWSSSRTGQRVRIFDAIRDSRLKFTFAIAYPVLVYLVSRFVFNWSHLPPHLQEISKEVERLACEMVASLEPGPEKSAGMRKLLEAKDCFVRQRLLDHRLAQEGQEAESTDTAQADD